jgi:hypothetical protein
MSLSSGTAPSGTYQFQTTLAAGSHTYFFSFADGNGGAARLPSTGTTSGPTVAAVTTSAQVLSLWPVYYGFCGHTATLWAQVKNTGNIPLPSNASVWFWVGSPSWSGTHWVGSVSVSGLAVNASDWYSYVWGISASAAADNYTYWAQVYTSHTAISEWKGPQSFTVLCGSVTASVISLYSVTGAQCGHTSTLWAQVKNTGSAALPSNAKVWYWVDGPSWSGSHWVGSASTAGLGVGTTHWYSYRWAIPASATAGSYTYWAQAWTTHVISYWKGPQTFTVSCGSASASIISLWQVTGARCGQSSTLWAQVKNTGSAALSSNAKVWYWVDGPSWSGTHWVGSASAAGLAVNATDWYSYAWAISASATAGSYTYWAQVWTTQAISPWKGPQGFSVSCP